MMGLYRSPVIPSTGLTTANQAAWTKIWKVTDYEPDVAVAATYGGGALASFDGRLFFGTMHVPFSGAYGAMQFYGKDLDTSDPAVLAGLAMGGHRSPTVFQGWNLETTKPAFRILYGETFLPRYDPAVKRFTIAYDDFHRNGMKQAPVFGASGFGWFFNAYVWAMEPFSGQLYIGTFDWSQLARVGLQTLMPANALASDMEASFLKEIDGKIPWEGADLFRFWSAYNKAEVEAVNGLGNDTNYGIRTFAHDDKNLWVGTANAMNLDPRGGWELRRLTWYTP
jgi:hypothetical protein